MTTTVADPVPTRAHWDSVWERTQVTRSVHTHIIDAVSSVIRLDGAIVLEIGCGSAVDSAELARKGACVFAADYAQSALQCAQHILDGSQTNVPLVAGDTFRLPFQSNTFDVVFSQGLVEHFVDPGLALREQFRIVRPGGFLCVDVPQTWSLATLYKRWQIQRGTWFAGWETSFTLKALESLLVEHGGEIVKSYGWLYFPSFVYGIRNLHTLDERHRLPFWLDEAAKQRIEDTWTWLERQRWYYRWLGCIGVIARKAA